MILYLFKNPIMHSQSKNIDIGHFVRDWVHSKPLQVCFLSSGSNCRYSHKTPLPPKISSILLKSLNVSPNQFGLQGHIAYTQTTPNNSIQ